MPILSSGQRTRKNERKKKKEKKEEDPDDDDDDEQEGRRRRQVRRRCDGDKCDDDGDDGENVFRQFFWTWKILFQPLQRIFHWEKNKMGRISQISKRRKIRIWRFLWSVPPLWRFSRFFIKRFEFFIHSVGFLHPTSHLSFDQPLENHHFFFKFKFKNWLG